MPSLDDLNDLIRALSTNGHNLNSTQKQNLVDLLRVALEVEGEQSLEGALAALREEIKNTLKTDDAIKTAAINELEDDETFKNTVKDELKADQAIIDQVKANLKTELTDQVKTDLKNDETFKNTAKDEAKNELKADQTLIDQVKTDLKADQIIIDQVKTGLKTELTEEVKTDLKADQIIIDQVKANLENEIKQKVDEFDQLKADLETQKAQVLQLTQKNQKLGTEKNELNTKVQKLQKELEAKKQPTEQPKPGKAPTYTAVVGVGLAAGLAVFIALEYTAKLEMLVTVGIALASALAVSGATYLALKPSTQVSETQEPQNANVEEGCCKA